MSPDMTWSKAVRAAALVVGVTVAFSPAPAAPPSNDTGEGEVVSPDLVLTIDREARWVVGTGVVTGTATCPSGPVLNVGGNLAQRGRRNTTVFGLSDFGAELICDGAPHPWSMSFGPINEPFRPGNAIATIRNGGVEVTRRVKLRDDRSGPNGGRDELSPGP